MFAEGLLIATASLCRALAQHARVSREHRCSALLQLAHVASAQGRLQLGVDLARCAFLTVGRHSSRYGWLTWRAAREWPGRAARS